MGFAIDYYYLNLSSDYYVRVNNRDMLTAMKELMQMTK